MRYTAIFLLATTLPAPLAGQSPDDRDARRPRRVSLVLELGGALGGPGPGLARQLREAGFDDTSPGGCFFGCVPPVIHPTQVAPGGVVGLTARFAVSPRMAVAAGYANTPLGGAGGYRANPTSVLGEFVLSHWDATIAWVGVYWRPHEAVRLGGGPGWYQLENSSWGNNVSQFGIMGEFGAELPANRRFFLDLAVRGHFVPAKDVEHGGRVPTTLRPDWTHATLLAGLGVRL